MPFIDAGGGEGKVNEMTVETQMHNDFASSAYITGEAIGLELILAQPAVGPIAVAPTVKFN